LLLAGAALVVMPLLPDHAVDSWGVLVPTRLWRMVVLILAVGMAGHLASRIVGARWGLPLAGFLSGFASSRLRSPALATGPARNLVTWPRPLRAPCLPTWDP
jgi:uncharacterized membrane protein (DUF4010 family)